MTTYRCILCKGETQADTIPSRCPSCGSGRDGLKIVRVRRAPERKVNWSRPLIPELLSSLEEQLGKVNDGGTK